MKNKYSPIDLSFLSESNKISTNVPRKKGKELSEINIPKYCFFGFYGKDKFELEVFCDRDLVGPESLYWWSSPKGINTQLNPVPQEPIYKGYLKLFQRQGFQLEGIMDYLNMDIATFSGPKGISTKYGSSIDKHISLTSEFKKELIPDNTKESVENSKRYFKEEDIYLISEVIPEQSSETSFSTNPFVLGIKNNEAFLIDKFGGPLENLILNIDIKEGRGMIKTKQERAKLYSGGWRV